MRERDLFIEALERTDPADRIAYLDTACAGDAVLRGRVLQLLAQHEKNESFLLDAPAPLAHVPPNATIDQPTTESPGTVLGSYKLIEEIGEGGMGAVWMAQQTEPVKRLVAVKLIKPGMDSKQVIARFEAERQALALMDHPNIARVLDAGTTAAGRPYFVMDLVKGVPITRYCDDHRLTPRERLELFVPVCRAVQHAHQKGVIHRDLKPSNVLVALYDGKPVPRVIDFGVAKAAGQQLTDKTLVTGFGAIVGTLEYMSPEQAEVNQLDVDTRSDIYSLGVLLYELLAGSPPFTRKDLEKVGMVEMLRVIREQEPSKPSTTLSTADGLPTLAANRGTEPAKLTRLVRGELDWIVMKSLEKDRNRRYESATGFAADIQRYLADEPVQACPPSAGYRLRKFARRNKGMLASVGAAMLAVLLGVAGLIANNRLVAREKKRTETALAAALAEKKRADQNLARARQVVKEYLLRTSESPHLRGADFHALRRELLETAVPFLREFVQQAQEDPRLEAERGRAYADLGFLSRELGEHERAMSDLDEAGKIFTRLAAGWPDAEYRRGLAEVRNSQGGVLAEMSRADPADQAFRQAHDLLDGPGSAPAAAAEDREALARTCSSWGELLRTLGRLDEAEALLRRAVALREGLLAERPGPAARGQLAHSWINLGAVLRARRQPGPVEDAFRTALRVLDARPAGEPPPVVRDERARAQALNNLAIVLREQGRPADAEAADRESVAIKEKVATTYPSVPLYRQELARGYQNLGVIRSDLGQPNQAREAYEKAVAAYERLVADYPGVPGYAIELAGTCSNMGRLVGDRGELEASLPWLAKAIETVEPAYRRNPRIVKVRETLCVAHWTRAMTLAGLGRLEPALEDWGRAIELDDGRYHNALRLERASARLNRKDHAGAAADARAVAESARVTAKELYQAAACWAVAARLAAGDAAQADRYAAQGVGALRRAAALGYPNPGQWKEDPDLRDLRSRDDFRQLLSEVGGKGSEAKTGK